MLCSATGRIITTARTADITRKQASGALNGTDYESSDEEPDIKETHEMNKSGVHKPLQSMSSFTEMKPIRGESEYTTSENRRLTAKEDIKRKSSSARPPDKAHISK